MAGSAEADDARTAAGDSDSGRGGRGGVAVAPRDGGAGGPGGGPRAGRVRAMLGRFDKRVIWFVGPTVAILAAVIGYPVVRAAYMSFHQDKGMEPDRGM